MKPSKRKLIEIQKLVTTMVQNWDSLSAKEKQKASQDLLAHTTYLMGRLAKGPYKMQIAACQYRTLLEGLARVADVVFPPPVIK